MSDKIIIYQSTDGKVKVDVHLGDETVWLSQDQMAELFGKSKKTVEFFKVVQNKLLWAISKQTAAELVYGRVDASLPLLGMQSFAKDGAIRSLALIAPQAGSNVVKLDDFRKGRGK